ncbi:MAG: hypothetical protein GX890_02725 [Firmicutes bacterium]|mgnify:CR=1 FL=1|jgi:hypothetical protein|nr:hypothetical protein [Bacillota bacterium]HPU00354.1 hypothetical protein [Bacillota bacterium]
MIFDNWYYHLLRIIPEAIATVALGTALIKEKYSLKQISIAGFIVGIINFILQRSPIKYGVHIPLGIIVFVLTLSLVLKLSVLKSAIAALLSFMILVLAEWITLLVQTRLLGFSEEQILGGTDLSKIVFSLPPIVIVLVLALIMQLRLCLYHGGQ